jgi:hypothetical protein
LLHEPEGSAAGNITMHLVRLPRADGTEAFINPLLVRAVVVNDKQTSMIQFDNDHVIMVREPAQKVAERIDAVLNDNNGGERQESADPSGSR